MSLGVVLGASSLSIGLKCAGTLQQIQPILDKYPQLPVAPWVRSESWSLGDAGSVAYGYALPDIVMKTVTSAVQTQIGGLIMAIIGPVTDVVIAVAGTGEAANLILGTLHGCVALSFVYPLDFIRQRWVLGLPVTPRNYSDYYTGFLASSSAVVAYRLAYTTLTATLQPAIEAVTGSETLAIMLNIVTVGAVVYPFDTVRARMIASLAVEAEAEAGSEAGDAGSPPAPVAKGSWETAEDMAREEGFGCFFHGVGYNVVTATFIAPLLGAGI